MNSKATISCSCGCMFQVSFAKSSIDASPVCPQCGLTMDQKSWEALRSTLASLSDFNYHILKWNSEFKEPKMLVPAITACTLAD